MSANSNLQNCCGDGGGWRIGEPVPLSITARPVRARGGRMRGTECRLHVLEAGWQERRGGVPGSERGWRTGWNREGRERGERQGNRWVCVLRTMLGKLHVQRGLCVCMLFIRAHPCACNYVCVCVHEHADVYSFLRSNAHSQMKSSNVSARKPQLGSHGSWSCKPQWSCLNEAG